MCRFSWGGAIARSVVSAIQKQVRRLLLLLLLPLPLSAQHTLVLSGGGSRGLAHGGVVVALERLGYESPVVVGTSMGAVVGALYAAGYSPIEVWDIIARQDWAAMFAADPFPIGPDREPRRPMVSIGFRQGRETVLEGFVAQSSINRRLVQLLFDAGVRAGNDFDSLPRRFRAITADLRTGREVVLARGDLARAVRASMAVPGVFSPIRWDDKVLIDGGIANNLGISVARQLSTSPVIAVDVVRPTGELEEGSALGIGLRAVRLLLHNARGARDSAELFVVPRIDPQFSEATFPQDAGYLLLAGYEGAMAQLPPRGAPMVAEPVRRPAPARIDEVRVDGVYDAVESLVLRTFEEARGAYDPERVLERVDALYATGMFHGIWPRVETDSAGRTTLVVRAEPISAAVATGAARWDTDVGPAIWGAVRTRTQLVTPLELRASVSYDRINRWVAMGGTFFSTILPPWVWSAGASWRERQVRVFDGGDIVRDPYVRRAGTWLAAEWRRLRPQQAFALALRAEHIDAQEGPAGTAVGPYIRFGAFPPTDATVGMPNVIEAEFRFGDATYTRLHASGSASLHGTRTRYALVGALTAVSADAPLDALATIGGVNTVPWLRSGEVRNRNALVVGADVAHPVFSNLDARIRLRAGAATRELRDFPDARWIHGLEMAGIWHTAIGPVGAGLATGADDQWRLNLSVGSYW